MNSYSMRLAISFCGAMILHVGLVLSADVWLFQKVSERHILFQTGESSVVLELVGSPKISSPASEEAPGLILENENPPRQESPDSVSFVDRGVRSTWDGKTVIRPRYPLRSRIRGEEGIVSLAVFSDARNRVRDVKLVESSGFPALDQAAIEAVQKASLSGKSGSDDQPLMISIRFRLVD